MDNSLDAIGIWKFNSGQGKNSLTIQVMVIMELFMEQPGLKILQDVWII